MRKIYFAHPLRGNVSENKQRITEIIRHAIAADKNILPLSPIHNFSFVDPEQYDAVHGMQLCFALLDTADELHVYGEWWQSEGCKAEICFAGCRGTPIRFKEMTEKLLGGVG